MPFNNASVVAFEFQGAVSGITVVLDVPTMQ